MAKRHVTISLEDFIHDQAKARGLNVSALCEDTIRQVLGSFNKTIKPEDCKHDWTLPCSVPTGLAKECKKCGDIKRVYVESFEKTMERANET